MKSAIKYPQKANNTKKIKVVKIINNTTLMFNSIEEASAYTKVSRYIINHNLNSNKEINGYKFYN